MEGEEKKLNISLVNKESVNTPYFHVGRATELSREDYRLYRFLEMIPGLMAWGTILAIIFLSIFAPTVAAIFIIAFDVYWVLKTAHLSYHLRYNWKRIKHNMKVDWALMLSNLKYEHVYHMIVLPYYDESEQVLNNTVEKLFESNYDLKKLIVVLGAEEKAGKEAIARGEAIISKYKDKFYDVLLTVHPDGVLGEMAGKGSNISYMAETARKLILDKKNISYEDVLVSAFDSDTVVYPNYFTCLTWHFLTCERPYQSSFQPVPLYNNNIWDAPAPSRVAAMSSTFWQMIQQERPEKLVTFSSHAVSFKTLYEAGYWQKNMVSEDSRIFWNLLVAHDGNYEIVSIAYPVSMDANLAPTLWQTMKNVYKQHRRWAYGSENVPYILMNFLKNKRIPLAQKIKISLVQLEGYWSLSTNPLIIFLLGWLPVMIGGSIFNQTILSYNLPIITRDLMVLSMLGLFLTAAISYSFLPPRPSNRTWRDNFFMIIQWVLVPVTITIFGAIPGLEAQTRLMLGRYMGFWVTPKHRGEINVFSKTKNVNI